MSATILIVGERVAVFILSSVLKCLLSAVMKSDTFV